MPPFDTMTRPRRPTTDTPPPLDAVRRQTVCAGPGGAQRGPRGLYWIAPSPPDGDGALATWWRLVDAVLAARPALVQFRDKSARAPAERRDLAAAFGARVHAAGSRWIVNDDAALALALDADGVHLGQDDLDRHAGLAGQHREAAALADRRAARRAALERLRLALGPERSLGVTCHNRLELATEAVAGGADLVAFGAFHPSPTKPEAHRRYPASLDLLRAARERLPGTTLCAIGGIQAAHAPALYAAGADLVAVVSAVAQAADPTRAAQAFAAPA